MNKMTQEQSEQCIELVNQAIRIMGSGVKIAKALGTTTSTISHWRSGKNAPSMQHALMIQKITKRKIKKEELRPDIVW